MKLRVFAPNLLSRRTQAALGLFGVLVVGTVATVTIGASGPSVASSTYATVSEGEVTATAGAAGNLESIDSRDLAFGTSGTVTRVYAKVGKKVRKGTRLAKMDQTPAEEDVATAKAALTAAEAAADGTDTTNGAAATGTADTGGATVALAGYESAPTVSATPTPTPSTSTRPPTSSSTPRSSGAPSSPGGSTKSSGTQGGTTSPDQLAAKVTQAKNDLSQAERTLDGTVITAPIAGTVLAVNGQAGDRASASSTFVTIGDLNDVQLQATFSQNDMTNVRVGQDAKITLSADPGKTYGGTVTHIDTNATSSSTNNAQLVKYGAMIAFDDIPSSVLIGQSGTVSVTTASATDTLYVPSSAVRSSANGTHTVQVRKGNTTVSRTVEIGVRGDAAIEIKSGLSQGERVVTSG
jgi:multidrug efflux pump subunit AcrA (membrane-fusion protein)